MSSYVIRPVEITKPLFLRASTATYIGADGLLKTAAVDVRRPLYVGGVNSGWIYEPAAATNLLTYSESLGDATWLQGAGLANFYATAASPIADVRGTFTARRFTAAAVTADLFLRKAVALAIGVFASASMWVYVPTQAGVINWGVLSDMNDVDTGTTYTSAVFNAWVRISSTLTATAARTQLDFNIRVNGGIPATGFVFHVCFPQFEVGAMSSHIPTTAATATRAAEIVYGASGRELVTTNAVETYLPWNPATSYTAATPTVAGSKVTRATTNRIYENIIGGVNAVLPENDPLRWSDAGPTNAMAMFDKEVGTVTTATDSIVVVLRPGEVNSLAVQELSNCNSIHVLMKDAPGGTVVFDQTLDLENADILDIYDWFFAPYDVRTDAILLDLPEFPDCEMTITLSGAGAVGCGLLVLGKAQELGSAEMGASIGLISFAEKIRSPRGTLTVRPGESARRMNLTVWADGVARNRIFRLMGEVDGLPCIWIGDNGPGFEALIVYGFYRDFDMVLSYPDIDLLNLQIEGLI